MRARSHTTGAVALTAAAAAASDQTQMNAWDLSCRPELTARFDALGEQLALLATAAKFVAVDKHHHHHHHHCHDQIAPLDQHGRHQNLNQRSLSISLPATPPVATTTFVATSASTRPNTSAAEAVAELNPELITAAGVLAGRAATIDRLSATSPSVVVSPTPTPSLAFHLATARRQHLHASIGSLGSSPSSSRSNSIESFDETPRANRRDSILANTHAESDQSASSLNQQYDKPTGQPVVSSTSSISEHHHARQHHDQLADRRARKKDQNRRAAYNYRRKKMEERDRMQEEELRLVHSQVELKGKAERLEDLIMYTLSTKTRKVFDKFGNLICFICPACLQSCDNVLSLRKHLNIRHYSHVT